MSTKKTHVPEADLFAEVGDLPIDPKSRKAHNFRKVIDRTGCRYGRLVILKQQGSRVYVGSKRRQIYSVDYLCRCDCGTEKIVTGSSLGSGTKSCGCLQQEACLAKPRKLKPGQAARNGIFATYRHHAGKRGLKWDVDDATFDRLVAGNCHYCGEPPRMIKKTYFKNEAFTYNGIDRLDNTNGYVHGNIVSCCKTCNHAKKDMTVEAFLAWISKAAAFQGFTNTQGP